MNDKILEAIDVGIENTSRLESLYRRDLRVQQADTCHRQLRLLREVRRELISDESRVRAHVGATKETQ